MYVYVVFSSDPARTVISILGSLGVLQQFIEHWPRGKLAAEYQRLVRVEVGVPNRHDSRQDDQQEPACWLMERFLSCTHLGPTKASAASSGCSKLPTSCITAAQFRSKNFSFFLDGPWPLGRVNIESTAAMQALSGRNSAFSTAVCTLILLPPRVIPKSWRKPDSYLGPSWPGKAILVQLP